MHLLRITIFVLLLFKIESALRLLYFSKESSILTIVDKKYVTVQKPHIPLVSQNKSLKTSFSDILKLLQRFKTINFKASKNLG